jgi:uncharacterized tellurite resistance protein B-like protein
MTTFFEHQRTSFKRNYLRNLISLAASDGNLDETEKALIMKIGQKRGLKAWQMTELLAEDTLSQAFLPESNSNRMAMLYDLMQIIYADSTVSTQELAFIRSIVAAFELREETVEELLDLFKNGVPSPEEWRDFSEMLCMDLVAEEKN